MKIGTFNLDDGYCRECNPHSFQESPLKYIFCLDCGKVIGRVDKMWAEVIDFHTSQILGTFYDIIGKDFVRKQ